MAARYDIDDCRRLLVVIPNWVGDVVMATPTLAALRTRLPDARITFLMRRYLAEVVAGGDWHNDELYWSQRGGLGGEAQNLNLIGRIRAESFDAALLLTNSFRSAAAVRLAGVPRRIGYARDGRGWLLTARLRPRRENGRLLPYPAVDSYAELAESVGCQVADRRLRLAVTPGQERAADSLCAAHDLDRSHPYAVIAPGAAFGAAKCWPAERFAEVCDRLREEHGRHCVVVGADREAELMRAIAGSAKTDVICLLDPGTTLGALKPIVRDAALLVSNDSGTRHYGNALGVPTVTIFGPTDPRWTAGDYPRERIVRRDVECGPCQLRECPLDLRCMTTVTADMVIESIEQLLSRPTADAATGGGGADGRSSPRLAALA